MAMKISFKVTQGTALDSKPVLVKVIENFGWGPDQEEILLENASGALSKIDLTRLAILLTDILNTRR